MPETGWGFESQQPVADTASPATGTGSCSLGMMRRQVGMPLGKQLVVSHNLVGLDQAVDHALHVDEMLRAHVLGNGAAAPGAAAQRERDVKTGDDTRTALGLRRCSLGCGKPA